MARLVDPHGLEAATESAPRIVRAEDPDPHRCHFLTGKLVGILQKTRVLDMELSFWATVCNTVISYGASISSVTNWLRCSPSNGMRISILPSPASARPSLR